MIFLIVTPMADRDRRRHIESLAREFLAARARGDAAGIVARLAPDFAYRARGAWPMWPYHAGPIDRTQFAEAVGRVNAEFEVLRTDIHEFLIDGEAAAIHATFAVRNRGAGAPAEFDLWMYFRFRDDLLVEAAFYVDVAKAAGLLPAGLVEVLPRDRAGRKAGRRPMPSRAPGRFGSANSAPGEAERRVAPDVRNRKWMERVARDFSLCGRKATSRGCWRGWRRTSSTIRAGTGPSRRLSRNRATARRSPSRSGWSTSSSRTWAGRSTSFSSMATASWRTGRSGSAIAARAISPIVDEWVCFRIRDGLIVEMASYVDSPGRPESRGQTTRLLGAAVSLPSRF